MITFFLISLNLLLEIALTKFSFFLPVRSLVLILFICYASLIHNKAMVRAFIDTYSVTVLLLILGVIGVFASVANGISVEQTILFAMQYIFQPIIIFVSIYLAIIILGPKAFILIFLSVVLFSSSTAVLQSFGINFFWSMRDILGWLQGPDDSYAISLATRSRPAGLSLSPIQLSYQIIAAYILLRIMFVGGYVSHRLYFAILFGLIIGAFACETRSLIGAILIGEIIFNPVNKKYKVFRFVHISLACVVVIGFFIFDISESRIGTLGDRSAQNRIALAYVAIFQFFEQPFGYGWGFDATKNAGAYWKFVASMPAAFAIFIRDPHNGFINFLLSYGIFGIITVISFAHLRRRYFLSFLFLFSPYFFHVLFHNAGIFVGDNTIWYVFSTFFFANQQRLSKKETRDVKFGVLDGTS